MHTKNFIVIEDDVLMARQMKLLLEMENYKVHVYHSAEDYLLNSETSPETPYIYLVDLNLPGLAGSELVKVIRYKDKVAPIFMLSGSTLDAHVRQCLEAGADDIILKPFNPEHLLLKIKNARLRLQFFLKSNMDFGVKIVPEARVIFRDGVKMQLTSKEFLIVEQLIASPDLIHTRESLMKTMGDNMTERLIDVHVSSVRRKLVKLNMGIQTLRGRGYRISMTA